MAQIFNLIQFIDTVDKYTVIKKHIKKFSLQNNSQVF